MNIPNITVMVNAVQRSKMEPEQRVFAQTAVQFYMKHLFEIQAVNGEMPKLEVEDNSAELIAIIMKKPMSFTREDLVQVANLRNIETNEEMTKENIVDLLGDK